LVWANGVPAASVNAAAANSEVNFMGSLLG
jgi:hypothetical protein